MKLFLTSIIISLFLNSLGQENKINLLIDEGIVLHDQGNYKKAIEKYEQAYKLDTTSIAALYEMSFSYLALKDYEMTEKLCKEALLKFPDSKLLKQVYTNYANCLDQKGEPENAIKMYKAGLEKFPDYYSLWFNKGITEYNTENHYDAINSFQKSIKLKPNHPSSWYYLGITENNIGNRISAILALSRFLTIENKGVRAEKISLFLVKKVNNLYYQVKNDNSTAIYSSAKSRIDTTPDIFSEIEINLSMLETMSSIPGIGEEYDTEIEEYNSHIKTIFELLKAYKNDNKGFYWEFAAPFFIELESKDFVSAFVYDIYYNFANEKKEIKWLKKNKGDYNGYIDWINNYKWE